MFQVDGGGPVRTVPVGRQHKIWNIMESAALVLQGTGPWHVQDHVIFRARGQLRRTQHCQEESLKVSDLIITNVLRITLRGCYVVVFTI